MSEPTPMSSNQTPEEVLESEIEDLEKRTLRSGWLWVAALLSLLIIAGTAFIVTWWDNRASASRSMAFAPEPMVLVEPKGTIHRVSLFRWAKIDGAATYIVLVKPVGRDEVELLRPVRETFLEPSETEASNLLPGAYTWSVEARSTRGTLIGYGDGSFEIQ